MADKLPPNTLDGPPPAPIRKAKPSLDDLGGMGPETEQTPGMSAAKSSPVAQILMGQQQVEQGLQMMMGAAPDLMPILASLLQQVKQIAVNGIAATTGAGAGMMPPPGGPMGMPPGMSPAPPANPMGGAPMGGGMMPPPPGMPPMG